MITIVNSNLQQAKDGIPVDIILAHRQMDFDALASMVAAQKIYPNSIMVADGKPNGWVQEFLSLSKDRLPLKKPQEIDLKSVSRIVLVDTHDLHRASVPVEKEALILGIPVEIYDHHPYLGELKQGMVIEPVGSCATILVEKLKGMGLPLSSFEATLLALGIYDDTGSLLFESTTVRDVRAVAYLLEQGANLSVISEYLRKPLTDEQKWLLQELLDNGQTAIFNGASVYIAYAESEEYIGGLALLAHRVGEMEGADTWFLLVKMEERFYLIGRSRGKGLAVKQIVEAFGGSGHEKAASASIKGGDPKVILEKLRAEISCRVEHPYLACELMSYPVKTVYPDTKLQEVEQILLRYGHTGVPVVEGAKLVGIISRRDVEKAIKHGLAHAPVKGFMTTDVVTVEASSPWEEVQRIMVQHDVGRVPVIESGKIAGIISRSDVLRLVHGSVVPTETELARQRSLAIREDIVALIERLPDQVRNLLEKVRSVADEEKCPVFLVGGFVRDLLMLVPTQDLDFVVEGNGPKFASALARCIPEAELTLHPEFGTARLEFPDGTHIDIATTRWEYYAFPGALPQVEESCLRDDLYRRDFTINTLAICLNSEHYPELIDYYGGVRDLQQGEIRILHNLSFIDDPTRMLRAVRFAQRYHFSLAKETQQAMRTALNAGVLKKLSAERFTEELMLIYREEKFLSMGEMLKNLGILNEWFGEELDWNFSFSTADADSWPVRRRWIMTLSYMNREGIAKVLARTKLQRVLREDTEEFIRLRTGLFALTERDYNMKELDRLLFKTPQWLIRILAEEAALKSVLTSYLEAISKMKMVMDGTILKQLGVHEGPEIGKILNRVREAWLEGMISSSAEEMRFVQEIIKH